MTDWADWTGLAVLDVVGTHARTNGGMIIKGLSTSQDETRQTLAKQIVAAMCQRRSPEAARYLATTLGVDPTPEVDEEEEAPPMDPERPQHIRPNGSTYYARKWGNYWDVDVLKKARAEGVFILLTGEAGTGKTAMAEAAFGEELITMVITGETTVDNIVGSFLPDGEGGYIWVDGPLLTAVKEGLPILMDEILLGDPKVLSVVYPLLDGRGFLDVSTNPNIGVVYAKEGFYLLGAGNPDAIGAKLSGPLKSRFTVQTKVTSDWDLALSLGVHPTVVKMAASLDARLSGVNATVSWAPQFRELLAFKKAEELWGLKFAYHNLMGLVPRGDMDQVMDLLSTFVDMEYLKPAKI